MFVYKKKAFILVFIYTSFVSSALLAQKMNNISGTILGADSTSRLNGVTVLNISSNEKTVSDRNGNFSINYRDADTIVFMHENWDLKIVTGEKLTDSVFLHKKAIVLNEVTVIGGRTDTRLKAMQQLEQEQNREGGIYYNGRPPIALLSPFGGKPITFLYERFSKNGKRARKMAAAIRDEMGSMKVDQVFNADLIRSIVPLKGDSLDAFVQKYRPTPAQVEGWTTYDVHSYIKKSYREAYQRK